MDKIMKLTRGTIETIEVQTLSEDNKTMEDCKPYYTSIYRSEDNVMTLKLCSARKSGLKKYIKIKIEKVK